jgi:two-component system sensor histidine kinase KdpD
MKVFPQVLNHVWAVLITLLTTALLYLLRGVLNTPTVALIYLVPVLFSTTLWGLSPGLVSGFIAFLTLNYFFILPYYTLHVFHTQDIIALAIFFLVAVITNQLVGRAKQNLEVARARETEITRLYEFSVRLGGVNTVPDIANTLVDQTLHTFRAARVKALISLEAVQDMFEAVASHETESTAGKPHLIPIQTARGVSGELHLWREAPLSASEERLFHTFATQGAFALERAAFLQSETRAQILEESDRLKSALLSSVSHELRTPLATIKAATTSLLSGEVDWEALAVRQELLAVVDEETDHLNHLVGNLLDMSRIEAGALKPDRQWNMLTEIVEEAQARMRRPLAQHTCQIDLPENLPLIPVDYHQIKRVFTNLISNSVKYAPPHSTIQIKADVEESQVLHVRVTNQGPHVTPEDLPRIFDKFYRVTNADQVTGTGLGLSICKGIIEAHGGQIWAENLPRGLAFHFTLPLTWNGRFPSVVEAEA